MPYGFPKSPLMISVLLTIWHQLSDGAVLFERPCLA
jgi:hypothetical protein